MISYKDFLSHADTDEANATQAHGCSRVSHGAKSSFVVHLSEHFTCHTAESDFAASAGYAWQQNELLQGGTFSRSLLKQNSGDRLANFAPWIPDNGLFAFVVKCGSVLVAAADRVRSRPLFYSATNTHFYLSDDAHWLRRQLDLNAIDQTAREEFRLAGFVSGERTLYSDINQIQAGEYLLVNQVHHGCRIHKKNYFRYLGKPRRKFGSYDLREGLDNAMIESFQRLMAYANGRTIVVPLSAGLDSRLVAAMLKRLDYPKVICYSYGKSGNNEAAVSAKVAKKLTFPWLFIRYSRSLWRQWSQSEAFKRYFRMADNFCMLPHIQDWPAVLALRREHLIPDDVVFVPGHTGDFIAGGHIQPDFLDERINIDRVELIRRIIKKHFRVNDFSSASQRIQTSIIERIDASLHSSVIQSNEHAAFLYESYDWRERQPKHVLNSLRVYEFFGYEWYLPLWDSTLLDFWQSVSLQMKVKKVLYKSYLSGLGISGIFDELIKSASTEQSFRPGWESLNSLTHKAGGFWERISKQYLDYFVHELAWYGMFSYWEVTSKNGFQNIYSFLADDYLSKL